MEFKSVMEAPSAAFRRAKHDDGAKALGVKIEASYSVGEYDILIFRQNRAAAWRPG
jgi:hypothetical protein